MAKTPVTINDLIDELHAVNELPSTRDYDRVKAAFAALRRIGYVTNMGSGKNSCCCGCLANAIGETLRAKGVPEDQMRAVYYSRQSRDFYDDYGDIRTALYINWSSPDPSEIVRALVAVGLKVEWDGSKKSCVIARPQMTLEEKREAERQRRYTEARAEYDRMLLELAAKKEKLSECEDYDDIIRLSRMVADLAGRLKYQEQRVNGLAREWKSIF